VVEANTGLRLVFIFLTLQKSVVDSQGWHGITIQGQALCLFPVQPPLACCICPQAHKIAIIFLNITFTVQARGSGESEATPVKPRAKKTYIKSGTEPGTGNSHL
jgi:hypothetical protein